MESSYDTMVNGRSQARSAEAIKVTGALSLGETRDEISSTRVWFFSWPLQSQVMVSHSSDCKQIIWESSDDAIVMGRGEGMTY